MDGWGTAADKAVKSWKRGTQRVAERRGKISGRAGDFKQSSDGWQEWGKVSTPDE